VSRLSAADLRLLLALALLARLLEPSERP